MPRRAALSARPLPARASAAAPDGTAMPPSLQPGRVTEWRPPGSPTVAPLDPWAVLRLARYRRREEIPPAIWETARRMAARADALADPVAVLVPVPVAGAGAEGARIADGPAFTGRAIGRLLAGCPLAVAFALTLGPRLEAEIAALADARQLLESYLLDTAGWAAIEAAARALRRDLARRLGPGWRPTHRLGPGHADWPLGEQAGLLGLFAGGAPPVRLSPHGVLLPFKSITGLFGVAPARGGRG